MTRGMTRGTTRGMTRGTTRGMTRGTTRGCHRWNFIYNIGRTDLSIKYKKKLFWSCYIFLQIILVLLQDHFFANYFGLVTRPFFFQIILVLLKDHVFFKLFS
jgi:hypothetical protein